MLSRIENKEKIIGVYKEKEPSFEKVFIHEISIFSGEDLRLILRIDIEDLPVEMPIKWKKTNVNTVQLIIEFIGVTIKYIGLNTNNYKEVKLKISDFGNGEKQLIGLDNLGNCILEFETIWIYIKNLSGYYNENASEKQGYSE